MSPSDRIAESAVLLEKLSSYSLPRLAGPARYRFSFLPCRTCGACKQSQKSANIFDEMSFNFDKMPLHFDKMTFNYLKA